MTDDSPSTGSHRRQLSVFLAEEWPTHRAETRELMRRVSEIQNALILLRQDTQHLVRLDSISDTLRDMKDSLIEVISGKNVVDVETVKDMMKAQQENYSTTIASISKIFGMIILILVGLKLAVPHWFGG